VRGEGGRRRGVHAETADADRGAIFSALDEGGNLFPRNKEKRIMREPPVFARHLAGLREDAATPRPPPPIFRCHEGWTFLAKKKKELGDRLFTISPSDRVRGEAATRRVR
jgi:hypothetical protein